MTTPKRIKAIGIMSGSSLDGLDLSYVIFSKDKKWEFTCEHNLSVPFPDKLANSLKKIREIEPEELFELDIELGSWIAEHCCNLISRVGESPDLIASHGHTAYHNPSKGYSVQIGNGQVISHRLNLPVITDFRNQDITKGGQGAPLVPIGDYHLFEGYDGYLNLGGIANMTVIKKDFVQAWDIAPCNQLLNHFARQLGHDYDKGGSLASAGDFDEDYHKSLSAIDFFKKAPPKSISNEWVKAQFLDDRSRIPSDGLHTYTYFLAKQVKNEFENALGTEKHHKVLVTGGGAKNLYLMDLLSQSDFISFEIPASDIIDFKEAIIFAFLGTLRWLGEVNVLSSVTGAASDSTAGTIYLP